MFPNRYIMDRLISHCHAEDEAMSIAEYLKTPYPEKMYLSVQAPPTKSAPRISRVRMDPKAIREAASKNSALDTEVVKSLLIPEIEKPSFRPLEPLRRGHICLLAANGQIDNIPLYDSKGKLDPVIIKGSSVKKLVETEEDKDAGTVTVQEHFEAHISVMNLLNGEVTVISENTEDLTNFFASRQESIDQAIRERYQPAIDPMDPKYAQMRQRISTLSRTLMGKQAPSSIVVAAQLRSEGHCFCIGQQGSGKTTVAIAAVQAAAFSRILTVTPSHNVQTWADEIEETNPKARVRIVNGIGRKGHPQIFTFGMKYAETDLETIRATPADPENPVYAIMGKDGPNKLTYPYRIISRNISEKRPLYHVLRRTPLHDKKRLNLQLVNLRAQEEKQRAQEERNFNNNIQFTPNSYQTCPYCWTPYPTGKKAPTERQSKCETCGINLAAPNIRGKEDRVYARATYISKNMPEWADLFIIDEAHQFRSKSSAQAEVYGSLAQRSKRTLALTGTLIGGKASECFRLLASMSPPFYEEFNFHDRKRFTELYGRYEIVFEMKDQPDGQVGLRSSRRAQGYHPKELNGFHPALMNHFWENTVFIRITDIKRDLPDPEVHVHMCELDDETIVDANGNSTTQRVSYEHLEQELKKHLTIYLKDRDMSPLGQYLQELLTYPENGWRGTQPMDPNSVKSGTPTPIITMAPLPDDRLYPKEEQAIQVVQDEIAEGSKCLIYVTHTRRRNTADRLRRLLEQKMIRVRIMPDGDAKGRLRWIQKVAPTTDVIICHPRKVETGLNLLEFPTIVWYEHDPSMYTVEQASARSHRVNQTKQVRIHHFAYRQTMQERYLRLIAEKADTSRMIYGELGTNGLSAFNSNSEELRQVIAREMMKHSKNNDVSDIDAVSTALNDMLYNQSNEDIQTIFDRTHQKQKSKNESAIEELHESSDFELPQIQGNIIVRVNSIYQTRLATEEDRNAQEEIDPITWDQWKKTQSIKKGKKQPANQLMML